MKDQTKSALFGSMIGTLAIGFFLALNPVSACADRHDAPEECRIEPADPFEPDAKLGSGAHKGECIDTANFRSFRILAPAEIAAYPELAALDPKETEFIANVQHLGDFWIAAIPKRERIARFVFQAEHFPPEWIAAHTQMRVDFRAGREPLLFRQTDLSAPPVKTASIVISNEAVPYRGGPEFNLYTGTTESFGFGKRLVSLPDMVEKIRKAKHWTEQFELRFANPEAQESYWDFALARFADPEMKQIYHTIYANCSNSLYEAFDAFLGRRRGTWDRTQTTLPLAFRWALKKRGLIDAKSELVSLNQEFDVKF